MDAEDVPSSMVAEVLLLVVVLPVEDGGGKQPARDTALVNKWWRVPNKAKPSADAAAGRRPNPRGGRTKLITLVAGVVENLNIFAGVRGMTAVVVCDSEGGSKLGGKGMQSSPE